MPDEWFACFKKDSKIQCVGPYDSALEADNFFKNQKEDYTDTTLIPVYKYMPYKHRILWYEYSKLFVRNLIIITDPKQA